MQHQQVASNLPTGETSSIPICNSVPGSVGYELYEAINQCHPRDLDELARQLWQCYALGAIGDADATLISYRIERRRHPQGRPSAAKRVRLPFQLGNFVGGRFTPRKPQRSPDRKASRDRRRMLGGSSALPDDLRSYYTEGERSALCIVAGEVKRQGICDFPIDKIAALAGVCRTTVQNALHKASRQGHVLVTGRPQRGRKNLTNIVRIISPKWLSWIQRGPSAAHSIGSNSLKIINPTKNIDSEGRKQQSIKKGFRPQHSETRVSEYLIRRNCQNEQRI